MCPNAEHILVYGVVGTNRGGIETYLLKMNSHMSKNTVFDYVIEGDACLFDKEIKERGGEICFINSRTKHPIRNIVDNYRLLKSRRKDVKSVYFNISSLSWIIPVRIASLLGYSVFVHAHNAAFIAANSGCLHKCVHKLNKGLLSHWRVKRLTCSDMAAEFMFQNNDDVTMIYNAIEVDKFKYDANTREIIRKSLDLKECTTIGFVGRLAYQKNPMFLIEMMKVLSEREPSIKLLVVGDGDMRTEFENACNKCNLENNIMVLGNRTDVNRLMQAMDTLVLPSYHEGLPYVVVEALCSGLTCFISDRITKQVGIDSSVVYLPISEGANIWADRIMNSLKQEQKERTTAYRDLEHSHFDIKNEALRLEGVLNER